MTDVPSGSDASSAAPALTQGLLLLFAVSNGIFIANMFYNQPLLVSIGRTFHVGTQQSTLVFTSAQVGYLLGLALLVPLGDVLLRNRLVPLVAAVAGVALLGATLATNVLTLQIAIGVAGMCSIGGQILVPYAATLAEPEHRGQVVGIMLTGSLSGILLARTVGGLLAQWHGWRFTYLVAALIMLTLAAVLARVLPRERDKTRVGYGALLHRQLRFFGVQPVLRNRALIGMFTYASFCTVWTAEAFLLEGRPYHYSIAVVGLIGLLGAPAALVAMFSGRFADRGWERRITAGGLLVLLATTPLLARGSHALWALIAALAIGYASIMAVHVQNQTKVILIDPEARSGLLAVYTIFYYLGGVLGTLSVGWTWSRFGWAGVVTLALIYRIAALSVWIYGELASRRQRRREEPLVDPVRSPVK